MPKGYQHLTYEQRCQIYTLKKKGDGPSVIAKEIGVDKSTVSRELRRNKGKRGYRFQQAHEKAMRRRCLASSRPKKMTPDMIRLIEDKLCSHQWSPEQIAGRLKRERSLGVSHTTIYRHIWKDKRQGGVLYKHLRHRGKKYNKRKPGKAGRGCIPHRVDISERPPIVDEKSRLGDWELDTIIGKRHRGAIVSMVERVTKYTKLIKVSQKTAEKVARGIVTKLLPLKDFIHSTTYDNGKEFSRHQYVGAQLGAAAYFATPYCSWERGLNEHTNGLVRQYIPKSSSLDDVTQERLDEIEALLNHRPRKVLGYQTPFEVFHAMSQTIAIV